MTNTVNQAFTSSESYEDDATSAKLIDMLCNVMHQCSFNDLDFDLLLATAARCHIKQLVAEQIEERSLS